MWWYFDEEKISRAAVLTRLNGNIYGQLKMFQSSPTEPASGLNLDYMYPRTSFNHDLYVH